MHPLDRRSFMTSAALASLLARDGLLAAEDDTNPLAPKPPQFKATAKSAIFIFPVGGTSQMDLFDPKPELTRQNGKPHPDKLEVHFHTQQGKLLASPFKFAKCGKAGVELSELLPHTAGIVDDITLVRSMTTDSVDHESALRAIHTGKVFAGRPAWGSWSTAPSIKTGACSAFAKRTCFARCRVACASGWRKCSERSPRRKLATSL